MDRPSALSLVRGARRRLEAVRRLRGAARGALAAVVVALPLSLTGREGAGWAVALFGALAGALAVAFRGRISATDAALFLDSELRTRERLVTVLGLPPGPLPDHLLREIAPGARVPRWPLPREIGYLPAALFVLFAAGLVPAAAPVATVPTVATAAETPSAAAPADASPALAKLAAGEAVTEADRAALLAAIDRTLPRPEERARARAALAEALGGEGAAAGDLERMLRGSGGAGRPPAPPEAREGSGGADAASRGAVAVAPYPDEREFLLAYRRHLAEVRDR